MGDAEDTVRCSSDSYGQLVMLVRHLLALDEHGSYADGFDPDNITFARTWVRAKLRHAVRPGVLRGDLAEDEPSPLPHRRPA
jgi:hypothetical protein